MATSDSFLARFEQLHPKLIDLSLGRIERLLAKMGHPERALPPVIHVAGTNGKGSTIAFMRAMLEAAGARVHVYTSPHLVRFHERIRIGREGGGRFVEEAPLVAAFEAVEAANGGEPITQFEITTAAAFKLFAESHADYLLLEVGLGGRFDSTNVIEKPAATVIAPVSMDHREFLGDSIEKIAFEKAGILKPGAPAIIAEQDQRAIDICQARARELDVETIIGGADFLSFEERGRLIYQEENFFLDLPPPRLVGRHQFLNAGTAIATLRRVAPERVDIRAIETGLQNVDWPARLQRLSGTLTSLTPAGAELWLDGGHNADGARVLADAMSALEEKSPRPLVLIAGTMARKDAAEILAPFVGLAQEFYAVPVPSSGAREPGELAGVARSLGLPAVVAGSVEEALRFLSARRWREPPRILVTGSLYLAGAVLEANGTLPR